MATKLFVGNLPYSATESDLVTHFSRIGAVKEAKIIFNKLDNRPRGIAFVTMTNEGDATRAIVELNNSDIGGRRIVVNEAHERPPTRRGPPMGGSPSTYRAPSSFSSVPTPAIFETPDEYLGNAPKRTYTPPPPAFGEPAPARRRNRQDFKRRSESFDDDFN